MKSKIPGPKPELPAGCARVALAGSLFFGVGIGLVFMAAGAAVFGMFALEPVRERWASRGWVEASCTIVSSAVVTEPGSDGPVSKAAIRYAYEAGGRRYESDRLRFGPGIESNSEALVAAHPAGSRTTCHHDTAAPERAVLSRELSMPSLVAAGFGSAFFLVGVVAVVFAIVVTRLAAKQLPAGSAPITLSPAGRAPSRALTPSVPSSRAGSRGLSLLAERNTFAPGLALALSVVWNVFTLGIFGPMLYLVPDWRMRAFVALFATPFVLIGIGFAVFSVRQLLKSMNPLPRVTLAREVRLGERCELEWTTEGRAARLRRLTISVQAVERATYSRGTSSYTDERVFFTRELLNSDAPDAMRRGSLALAIPRETMPSFASEHNAIVWRVTFTGEIPRWPDLETTFPFEVLPPGRSGER